MFRLRFVFNGLIFLGLILLVSSGSVRAGVTCPTAYCQYLPIVSSPAPVQVTQIESFNWFGEVLRVTGEVMNIANYPVYEVEVEVSAYDASNQLIGTVSGPTVITATLPGQLNLFAFVTDFPSGSVGSVSARITNLTLTSTQVYIAPTLVMTDVQFTLFGYTVAGEIRNDTNFALTHVQGWSWTLDQLVPAVPPYSIVDYLAPGATATFAWGVDNVYWAPAPPVRIVVQGIAEP